MPKSYHALKNDQMIMTFTDLEGDYDFLKRSLALYRKVYAKVYPTKPLKKDDFTLSRQGDREYLSYPENVICVNAGDLTDRSCSNMRLVKLMYQSHERQGDRMISIVGNRETTKFRLDRELSSDFIEKILLQEKNLASPPPDLVWIDHRGISFLSFLKLLFDNKDSEQVVEQFMQQSPEFKLINYTKWMLANSCGAPDLWSDLAKEAGLGQDEQAILQEILHFFATEKGEHVRYLNQTQIGVQIGTILFSHAGIHDNSFVLPKTLVKLLKAKELRGILDGHQLLIAKNIGQLLELLNAWYAEINRLRFSATKDVDLAIAELIQMGLPIERNKGASLINLPAHNNEGSYGLPLKASNHKKLLAWPPVYISYHGHKPAKAPQYATTINANKILQRIDGDTSHFRRNNSAVAIAFHQKDEITHIEAQYIDESEKLHVLNWPGRGALGEKVA